MLNNLAIINNPLYLVFIVISSALLSFYFHKQKTIILFAIIYLLVSLDIINIGFLESSFFNEYFLNNFFLLTLHLLINAVAFCKIAELIIRFLIQTPDIKINVFCMIFAVLLIFRMHLHLEGMIYNSKAIAAVFPLSGPLQLVAKNPLIYRDCQDRLWYMNIFEKKWEVKNLSCEPLMTVSFDGEILAEVKDFDFK